MHLIYHITHIENLKDIFKNKGLFCDSEISRKKIPYRCIAYQTLKERRLKIRVSTSSGGNLADYVPFYFCNRSPMLYAIHKGQIQLRHMQNDIIYFVSSVEKVEKSKNLNWCFTDGHAVEAMTSFYEKSEDLSKIDWSIIENWSWKNTQTDNDRKRKKQAEFLVYKFFPWELIEKIVLMDNKHWANINHLLRTETHKPDVMVEKKWYY